MKYFIKLASSEAVTKYKVSPKGILYVAPTGSGKTRKALEATRENKKVTVVGTASLQENFDKEEQKAFHKITPRETVTYSKISRGHTLSGGNDIILDESQYIRNSSTKAYKNLMKQRSKYNKALLLTATPMYNEPADIATQVNFVAGNNIVPTNKTEFYKKYYRDKKVSPGFLASLIGIKPGSVRTLKTVPANIKRYVYIEPNSKYKDLMPKKEEEVVKVPMSKEQYQLYKYLQGKAPLSVRYKMKRNLPPSKTEAKKLNAYLIGVRQVSNSTAPFVQHPAFEKSTKLDKMVSDLKKEIDKGGKVIVYSNFLKAGIEPMSRRLARAGINYTKLVGSMSKSERAKQIKKYNDPNNVNVFLYSGAGAEGINLPKTTLVQLMEPYWNESRLNQASARGIRRGDNPNRTVKVKTYISTLPDKKIKILKKRKSSDEYLENMSNIKNQEILQMLKALGSYGQK